MSLPIRFTKSITSRTLPSDIAATRIVTLAKHPDVDDWLRLHSEIFLNGQDPWTEPRFCRELLNRAWFSPQRMWWAISEGNDQAIGTITLEIAGETGRIHWLMVDPAARRLGIASALLVTLENSAWDCGVRQLTAETLSTWAPAVAFYRRHGYQPPPIAERAKSR